MRTKAACHLSSWHEGGRQVGCSVKSTTAGKHMASGTQEFHTEPSQVTCHSTDEAQLSSTLHIAPCSFSAKILC